MNIPNNRPTHNSFHVASIGLAVSLTTVLPCLLSIARSNLGAVLSEVTCFFRLDCLGGDLGGDVSDCENGFTGPLGAGTGAGDSTGGCLR